MEQIFRAAPSTTITNPKQKLSTGPSFHTTFWDHGHVLTMASFPDHALLFPLCQDIHCWCRILLTS